MHNMCNFLKLLFSNILGNNPFGIYILNVIKFTEKKELMKFLTKIYLYRYKY